MKSEFNHLRVTQFISSRNNHNSQRLPILDRLSRFWKIT